MEISNFAAGAVTIKPFELSITIDRFSLFHLPARFIGAHARTTIMAVCSEKPSVIVQRS
jgi:hypothetical protein